MGTIEINEKGKPLAKTTSFWSLKIGEPFIYGGSLYLKGSKNTGIDLKRLRVDEFSLNTIVVSPVKLTGKLEYLIEYETEPDEK